VIEDVTAPEVQRAIETVWRLESPKLIAALTRFAGDLSLAEDLAHDALVSALEQWPEHGTPDNPGAWLMTAAKRRAVDHWRHRGMLARKHEELVRDLQAGRTQSHTAIETAIDDDIGDDLLRLIFIACHPVLSTEARVALTLRLLGGLSTDQIARAFLVSEPTIAQRIVRAKKTLASSGAAYEVPRGADRAARLTSVLEVLYLIFNEGYSAAAGDALIRWELCEESLRLGRVLAGLVPGDAEVHGLVALMELQASRLRARVGSGGEAIPLADQVRARWDRLLIGRGLAALSRAEALGGRGPYTLQAAIAACHARAVSVEDTDWRRIAGLYEVLIAETGSPVVRLNHAVAVAMAEGPAAGLSLVDTLDGEGVLAGYHYVAAVRGDLLEKLGRCDEAGAAFTQAAARARNTRERDLLLARADACANPEPGTGNPEPGT
jgi:RNA polymerase sigma factor (sigma-70 family)